MGQVRAAQSARAPGAGTAPAGAWARLEILGRRWPAAYRQAHRLALALLVLCLASGAVLYFPALHSGLVALLPAVLAVHVWSGVLLGALLGVPLVAPPRRVAALADWQAALWLVAGLTLTGFGLWLGAVPAVPRAGAYALHGVLAVAILAWTLYHAAVRLQPVWRGRAPGRAEEARGRLRRRGVLADVGRALVGTAAASLAVGVAGRAAALVRALEAGAGSVPAGPAAGPGGRPRPLPGFQIYTVTGRFPDLAFDPATWRLEVEGLVERPLELTLEDILRLPQVTVTRDFHCVTGWVVPAVTWVGVRVADVLALAQPQPQAGWVAFDSFDGVYSDSLSLAQATAEGVILAHRAGGAPLAPEQGAPLRLVVPQMYGYKSVKWVGRLRLIAGRELGYWEQRGYGPDAYLGTVNGWPTGFGGLLP